LTPIDLIILIVVLIGFILGFKDGFVRKIIGLLGFILAIIIAALFYEKLGTIIESFTGIEIYLSKIVAGVLIFLIVMILVSLLKRWVHPFDKVNNFINQILGGVIGAVQILFFLSAVFFLLKVFEIPGKNVAESSLFYSKTYDVLPVTIDYLNSYTPKTKEILKDYINEEDTLK
jgi:membrane protein required for colicin V production